MHAGEAAAPPSAASDTADEAEFRFRRGAEAYRNRRFDEALSEFFESNRLVPNRNVAWNIARCMEQLGLANEAFRRYAELHEDPRMPEEDRKQIALSVEKLRPQLALLRVESVPAGATIFVDRRDLGALGLTPRTLALPPGAATVLVDLAGYRSASATVQVRKGAEEPVKLELERIWSTLALSGTEGAEVRVDRADGAPAGRVPGDIKVLPGSRVLYATAPGHQPLRYDLNAPPDARVAVELKLEPLPPPSGALVVRANLDGALVAVDGKESGFTPTVIEKVPVGAHEVVVSYEGREPHRATVEVRENERTPVVARLHWAQPEVVAAAKVATRAKDAPASITVLTGEEIRAFGWRTLGEAVEAVRGLYLTDDRSYVNLGFRGFSKPGDFNNRVLILRDGHTMNEVWLSSVASGEDLDADLTQIERIEIVRGPGSVLYGSAALSGLVNLVRRAAPQGTHAAVEAQSGSFGQGRARGWASLRDGGNALSLAVGGFMAAGEGMLLTGPGGALLLAKDPERAFNVDLRAQAGELQLTASLNNRDKEFPTGPYETVLGVPGTGANETRAYAELKWGAALGEGGAHFDARAFYDTYIYRGRYVYGFNNDDTPCITDCTQRDIADAHWGGLELRARAPELFGMRLTLGAEGQYRWVSSVVTFQGTEPRAAVRLPRWTGGVYLVDDWRPLPWLLVSAAARADIYPDLPASKQLVLTPRLAIIAQPYEAAATKLLFGTAFRAPSVYEDTYTDGLTSRLPTDLRPEDLWSVELEHTHPFTEEVSLTAAAFYSSYSSLISFENDPDPAFPGLDYVYRNKFGATTTGGEIEVRYQPALGVLVAASWSVAVTRNVDLNADGTPGPEDGKPLPNGPQNTGAFRLMYPIVPGALQFATEIVYNSARLARDHLGHGEMLLVNAAFSGEYAPWGLRWQAAARNLLDQHVELPVGEEVRTPTVPQLGRELRVSAGFAF